MVQSITPDYGSGSLPAGEIDQLLALEGKLTLANQMLLRRFAEIEASLKNGGYPSDKINRHTEMVERHSLAADRLLNLLGNLRAAYATGGDSDSESLLEDLRQYFIDNIFQPDPPLLNSQPLPVMMEVKKAPILEDQLPSAIPYPVISKDGPDPADLDSTIDVQFTDDVIAMADSLNNSPVEMYNFVRDNFEFEPYLGSRKGSQQALTHRRGNDYDQASLLIALLRVSGIPARYSTGTIKMTIDQATNWLGIDDKINAASILATAGMEAVIYIVGSDTVAISCRRVWVEAWVPFINYRGAVNDSTGFMWVPMDPTFKQYSYQPGINLPAEIGFDSEAFVNDYISTFHPETPVELFRQMLLDSAAVYHPGADYEDLLTMRSVIKETDGILPGTLPYTLMSMDSTFSEIASVKRYYIEFHLYDGAGMDLDYSTSLPEIAEKQVTISYVGATAADQEIIDTSGGIFSVDLPYLVDLKPVLKIDGCEVALATGDVMMGTTHYSDMYFTPPTGASNQVPTVSNVIIAGNYQGIGIDTEDAFPSFWDLPETSCDEEYLGQEVHQTALTYLNNVDVAGDELSGLMHQVVMNDVSEAIVGNTIRVLFSGGLPVSFEWTGMIVDADRKIIGPFSVDGIDNTCDYMRLGGADGSIQENVLFETRFEEEAISAIKILELASDSGITICEITTSIAADCPGIDQPSHVITAINNALAQGRHIIIPERGFTYYNWTGTGWIDLDPATCAAGYIISGGHNGGATVQEWDITIPDLFCIQPIGPVTVTPSATGDLYCAENTAKWTFTVPTIKYWGKDDEGQCELLKTDTNKEFPVKYTIKYIADKWGPGQYTFRCGSSTAECGCTMVQKQVTIVKIEFPSGDFLVYKGKDREMEVKVTPSSASGSVTFESANASIATVSGSAPKLTVNGLSPGQTTVKGLLNAVECKKKDITVFKVDITTPHGDPTTAAGGNSTNERVFNSDASGKLTVECEATPIPNTSAVKEFLKDNKIRWTIQATGSSALTWDSPWSGDVKKGEGLDCEATFTGLPSNNTDFGLKQVKMEVLTDGASVDDTKTTNIEVFYTGTAKNHPGGDPTHPNWFHYYKENAGGGAYGYEPAGRSHSLSAGGVASVKIGDDSYITTNIVAGQLTATGWSGTNRYYANFLGVLAHESQHATGEINPPGGPTDRDSDWLTNDFETGTSSTDPDDKYSAHGVLPASGGWSDDEIYAGGPVEQAGIGGADTSQDWASPGTNK
jgi:transglutaminase-like putative cysteine protease